MTMSSCTSQRRTASVSYHWQTSTNDLNSAVNFPIDTLKRIYNFLYRCISLTGYIQVHVWAYVRAYVQTRMGWPTGVRMPVDGNFFTSVAAGHPRTLGGTDDWPHVRRGQTASQKNRSFCLHGTKEALTCVNSLLSFADSADLVSLMLWKDTCAPRTWRWSYQFRDRESCGW